MKELKYLHYKTHYRYQDDDRPLVAGGPIEWVLEIFGPVEGDGICVGVVVPLPCFIFHCKYADLFSRNRLDVVHLEHDQSPASILTRRGRGLIRRSAAVILDVVKCMRALDRSS